MRERPNEGIVRQFQIHEPNCFIAAPVWHELLIGLSRLPSSRRGTTVETYLSQHIRPRMTILAYDQVAAEWHAAERARLVAIGRTPPYMEGQIAAIAATNGLVLVTANVADFAHFNGLRVEDWRT